MFCGRKHLLLSASLSLCSQVPSEAVCSPSNVSKVDLNQIEGAVQDLCVTSPTQAAADFGNRSNFKRICFECLTISLFSLRLKWTFVLLWIPDISNIPEAMTPDLSDMVSTNDIGQSSMFANYGDDSGDQCSLGKYLYTLYKWLNCAAEWRNYMLSMPSCLKRTNSLIQLLVSLIYLFYQCSACSKHAVQQRLFGYVRGLEIQFKASWTANRLKLKHVWLVQFLNSGWFTLVLYKPDQNDQWERCPGAADGAV